MTRWQPPPAFADFVRARHTALLRFAYVLCGDEHRAADLVQDALERTALAWNRVERRDDPEGYVRRTIINLNLNGRRRSRREHLVADAPDRAQVEATESDGVLWDLLRALPPAQRTVLALRYYLDMSEIQIAETLGCSPGTVKSNSSRAIAKLRAALSAPDSETVTR